MGKTGQFAVIGLGRFGRAVAQRLATDGQSVLAIDRDRERVEQVAETVDSAVTADTTDEETLVGLHLERMSCVVVTIGARATEASILTTALLRQLGVPRVVVRAFNELHSRVLLSVGASEVVNPEEEMGRRLAMHLAHPGIVDQIQLGDAVIAEVEAPEAFVGSTLAELDLRNQFDVTVLALRREPEVRPNPGGHDRVENGDILLMMGAPEAIKRLAALE